MLGQLKWSPDQFYRSTLLDISAALKGHYEYDDKNWQWTRYSVREIIFWLSQNIDRKKVKEAEQLFGLPMDNELKRARHKKMPKAQIIKSDGSVLE